MYRQQKFRFRIGDEGGEITVKARETSRVSPFRVERFAGAAIRVSHILFREAAEKRGGVGVL
jgi:hypothetical protein